MNLPRLDAFVGRWTIDRTIQDRRAGSNARFEGTAEFTPDADGLTYFETGQLWLDGHPPFKAERRYLWRSVDNDIHILFDDGRPFHTLQPGSTCASHWCDPDTYDVRYDFETWPTWRSTWDVSGPQKAYHMVSAFRRADE